MNSTERNSIIDIVNTNVGHQIKFLRNLYGINIRDLGTKLGISLQQIHKYEQGESRVNAGYLYILSKIFDVSPSVFYSNIKEEFLIEPVNAPEGNFDWISINNPELEFQHNSENEENQNLYSVEAINILKTFYSIKDENVKKAVLKMLKAAAS